MPAFAFLTSGTPARRWLDPAPDGFCDQLGSRVDAELAEDVDQVRLHCGARDKEPGRDLGVAEVLAGQARDLELGRRQAGPARGGAPAHPAPTGRISDRLLQREP